MVSPPEARAEQPKPAPPELPPAPAPAPAPAPEVEQLSPRTAAFLAGIRKQIFKQHEA
jgi:hypothetical protein